MLLLVVKADMLIYKPIVKLKRFKHHLLKVGIFTEHRQLNYAFNLTKGKKR